MIYRRHARICRRAGVQVNQHQPLLPTATACTLKRLGVPHSLERGELFTVDRSKKLQNRPRYPTKRCLRDALPREFHDKWILLDSTHTDPKARAHLRGGIADCDGSTTATFEARKR